MKFFNALLVIVILCIPFIIDLFVIVVNKLFCSQQYLNSFSILIFFTKKEHKLQITRTNWKKIENGKIRNMVSSIIYKRNKNKEKSGGTTLHL